MIDCFFLRLAECEFLGGDVEDLGCCCCKNKSIGGAVSKMMKKRVNTTKINVYCKLRIYFKVGKF